MPTPKIKIPGFYNDLNTQVGHLFALCYASYHSTETEGIISLRYVNGSERTFTSDAHYLNALDPIPQGQLMAQLEEHKLAIGTLELIAQKSEQSSPKSKRRTLIPESADDRVEARFHDEGRHHGSPSNQ